MTTAIHNTCHSCGASITGFTRIIVDGNAFHAGCAPVRSTTGDGGPQDFTLTPMGIELGESISWRDFFASAALQTLKIEHYATPSAGMHGASYGTAHVVFAAASPVEIARRSYEIADAMLAARKAKP